MDENGLFQKINSLQEKLGKAQRQVAGFKEKSKILEMQYEDSKGREQATNELVKELLERQRELNVMLNRANIMLSKTQEAMAVTSLEFNEMAKALPEQKKAEWSDRVSRINDLFKKTGIQDAEVLGLESSNPVHGDDSFSKDEMENESETAFGKKSIWDRKEQRVPPKVEAELVDEGHEDTQQPQKSDQEDSIIDTEATISEENLETAHDRFDAISNRLADADNLVCTPRKKSWWQRIAG